MLQIHCEHERVRYIKTVSWDADGGRESAKELLDAVRFDVLEEACRQATGKPCPP
jgi:hypothetical protein